MRECGRERSVCVCMRECVREKSVFVCVCLRERVRERSVCVCMCLNLCVCLSVCSLYFTDIYFNVFSERMKGFCLLCVCSNKIVCVCNAFGVFPFCMTYSAMWSALVFGR